MSDNNENRSSVARFSLSTQGSEYIDIALDVDSLGELEYISLDFQNGDETYIFTATVAQFGRGRIVDQVGSSAQSNSTTGRGSNAAPQSEPSQQTGAETDTQESDATARPNSGDTVLNILDSYVDHETDSPDVPSSSNVPSFDGASIAAAFEAAGNEGLIGVSRRQRQTEGSSGRRHTRTISVALTPAQRQAFQEYALRVLNGTVDPQPESEDGQ